MSSLILKLHMRLFIFLDIICSYEFIGGYSFFYFYCTVMSKQNHWEQRPMCSIDNYIHRAKRIIKMQEVIWDTDEGMLYHIDNRTKWSLQLTLKTSKQALNVLLR